MLVTNGLLVHRYVEVVHAGMRLGRNLVLDARSLAYTVEAEAEAMRQPIRPASYACPLPILDQSDLHAQGIHEPGEPDELGSCTGNSGAEALAPLGPLERDRLADTRLVLADPAGDERFAIELYHQASLDDKLEKWFEEHALCQEGMYPAHPTLVFETDDDYRAEVLGVKQPPRSTA